MQLGPSFSVEVNPFPNDKFETRPKWKGLQATIYEFMKMVASSLDG